MFLSIHSANAFTTRTISARVDASRYSRMYLYGLCHTFVWDALKRKVQYVIKCLITTKSSTVWRAIRKYGKYGVYESWIVYTMRSLLRFCTNRNENQFVSFLLTFSYVCTWKWHNMTALEGLTWLNKTWSKCCDSKGYFRFAKHIEIENRKCKYTTNSVFNNCRQNE